MTLIVARNTRGTIHVLADTLLSNPKADLRHREIALKVFSASDETLICYAGSPELAHSAIKQTWRLAVQNRCVELANQLSDVEGVDFIVVNKDKIHRIQANKVEMSLPNAWIGNWPAFREFRGASRSLEGVSTDIQNWTATQACLDGIKYRQAFEHVVDSRKIPSVGGPITVATAGGTGAAYASFAVFAPPSNVVMPGKWQAIDFGNAENGGFGYTTVTPRKKGITGWGLYYFQSFSGFYFHADPLRGMFKKHCGSARTANEFCRVLSAKTGHEVMYSGQLG